jgi:hypothetical protein
MQNHPYSKLGPIFTHVNRFNFQGLVLSSYLISMIMHLPRIHLCHLIFHSLHYHLVIRDHLLMVLTEFLTLIKSMTIWPLSYAKKKSLSLSPLEFKINCSEAILWSIFTPFNLLWPTIHLLVHFEPYHIFIWLGFEPYSKYQLFTTCSPQTKFCFGLNLWHCS